jgi:hypothetical protein
MVLIACNAMPAAHCRVHGAPRIFNWARDLGGFDGGGLRPKVHRTDDVGRHYVVRRHWRGIDRTGRRLRFDRSGRQARRNFDRIGR